MAKREMTLEQASARLDELSHLRNYALDCGRMQDYEKYDDEMTSIEHNYPELSDLLPF